MNDTELYQRVLGLEEPWFVQRVEMSVEPQRMDIHLAHREGVKWSCPQCEGGSALACYDHAPVRTWRHLDTCQFQTHVHARVPRVECQEHGVVNLAVPWAKPQARFTLLFERLIIDVLKVTHTIAGVCRLLGITWDEGMAVMKRAVKRGQERKQPRTVAHLGVDEKAFRKGHSYMTIVCDLDKSTVEYITEDRKTSSLAEYFETRTDEQLAGIEAIAMDMWEPYVQATMDHVPLAKEKIVFDKFHIMKQMNEAVDKVRRSEHRQLKAAPGGGDDTLTGSKYLWLYGKENVPAKSREKFKALRDQSLRTGRAWSIKETLRGLWDYQSMGWGRRFFNKWFGWARRSALEPVKKAALTFKRHLDNILTYCVHGITNAAAESLNSRIMALKRISSGRRNKENFKTAVYFFHGGLDVYP